MDFTILIIGAWIINDMLSIRSYHIEFNHWQIIVPIYCTFKCSFRDKIDFLLVLSLYMFINMFRRNMNCLVRSSDDRMDIFLNWSDSLMIVLIKMKHYKIFLEGSYAWSRSSSLCWDEEINIKAYQKRTVHACKFSFSFFSFSYK